MPHLYVGASRVHGSLDTNWPRDSLTMMLRFITDNASFPVQKRVMASVSDCDLMRARRFVLVTSGHLRRMMTVKQKAGSVLAATQHRALQKALAQCLERYPGLWDPESTSRPQCSHTQRLSRRPN